jgi:hypothetical protein
LKEGKDPFYCSGFDIYFIAKNPLKATGMRLFLDDQARDLADHLGGNGLGEVKTLRLVAIAAQQKVQLVSSLNTLGDHLQIQAMRHGNDGSHDRRRVGIRGQTFHKTTINLQPIDFVL